MLELQRKARALPHLPHRQRNQPPLTTPAWAAGWEVTNVADVEIDREDIDWMRCLYREARSKTKAIPILAQCTGLTRAQVRAVLGLPPVEQLPFSSRYCSKSYYGRSREEWRRLQLLALELLHSGRAPKEIAKDLGLSTSTVRRWGEREGGG